MFKDLDANLKAMSGEVSKLQTAVEHINEAKSAAHKAVEASNTLQTSFANHLNKVSDDVQSILKPHKELIRATDELIKTIGEVDFPSRLDKQEKEINMLKILLYVAIGLSIMGIILPLAMR